MENLSDKDESFWESQVRANYPKLVDYREPNESWHDYYRVLPELQNKEGDIYPWGLIKHNRMKLLEKVKDKLRLIDADFAAMNGLLHILVWMVQNKLYHPSKRGIAEATENGHVHILEWARQENLSLPTLRSLTRAALNGHTNVIEWAVKVDIYHNKGVEIANKLAEKGCMDMIKWLEENNLPLPNEAGAKDALKNGCNDLVDWLAERGIPPKDIPVIDSEEIVRISEKGSIEDLEKLEGPIPSYVTACAARFNRPDLLKWLEEHGFNLTSEDADAAAERRAIASLDYLYEKGILPSRHGANEVVIRGYLDILNLLESRGILPNKEGADEAMQCCPKMVSWLVERGFIPGRSRIICAIMNDQLSLLKFLNQEGHFQPSQEDIDLTFLYDAKKIRRWLYKLKLKPSREAEELARLQDACNFMLDLIQMF